MPDLWTKEGKAWKASNLGSLSNLTYTDSSNVSSYSGKITASGKPDMRTTAGKEWAKANGSLNVASSSKGTNSSQASISL